MRTLQPLQLLLALLIIIQSCKKQDNDKPPQLTLTDVRSELPQANFKSCALPNNPIKGDRHVVMISYTSNTDLKKYTVELRMIVKYSVPGAKSDTLVAARVDSLTATTIYQKLCLYLGPWVAYADVDCQITLRDPTNNSVVLTSNTKTVRINNPVDYSILQQIRLTTADIRLVQLNNCQTASGTGSSFNAKIFYSPNIVIKDYYIEIIVDFQFNDGGAKRSFVGTPVEVDGIIGAITQSSCFTFGDRATALNVWFTVKLYQKDDRGNKVGDAFLQTNTIGPFTIAKPAGAKRVGNANSGISSVR